jgi:hypothetical protein
MRACGRYRALAIAALAGVAFSVGTAAAQDLQDPALPDVEVQDLSPVPLPPSPSLPAPQLPAPAIPAPQLPAAPTPTVPSLSPSLPAPAPSGSGSTAQAPRDSSGTTAGDSGSGGGSAAASSSRGGAATYGARDPRTEARTRSGKRRRRAGDDVPEPGRRLRATVRRLRGCLGRLPQGERRVLLLRAGVGPRPALSRAQVGERLHASVPRVARLERRGLRRLRTLDRNAGCGAAPVLHGAAFAARGAAPPRAPVVSALAADTPRGALPNAAGDASDAKRAAPQSGVKDAFGSSPPSHPATAIAPEDGGTIADPKLFVAAIALVLLGYAVFRRNGSLYRL